MNCQSDAQGNPQSEWLEAVARVLDKPEDEGKQRRRLEEKYDNQYKMAASSEGNGDRVVLEIQTTMQ